MLHECLGDRICFIDLFYEWFSPITNDIKRVNGHRMIFPVAYSLPILLCWSFFWVFYDLSCIIEASALETSLLRSLDSPLGVLIALNIQHQLLLIGRGRSHTNLVLFWQNQSTSDLVDSCVVYRHIMGVRSIVVLMHLFPLFCGWCITATCDLSGGHHEGILHTLPLADNALISVLHIRIYWVHQVFVES